MVASATLTPVTNTTQTSHSLDSTIPKNCFHTLHTMLLHVVPYRYMSMYAIWNTSYFRFILWISRYQDTSCIVRLILSQFMFYT